MRRLLSSRSLFATDDRLGDASIAWVVATSAIGLAAEHSSALARPDKSCVAEAIAQLRAASRTTAMACQHV